MDIAAEALKEKIDAFRGAVVSRNPEVNTLGKELYDLLIGPPAADLKTAKTLMLAPDGALRYLSFAALHDGEKYLIQRYTLSNFTDMTKDHITDRPIPDRNFTGFGVSRGGEGLSALPAVDCEGLHCGWLFSRKSGDEGTYHRPKLLIFFTKHLVNADFFRPSALHCRLERAIRRRIPPRRCELPLAGISGSMADFATRPAS